MELSKYICYYGLYHDKPVDESGAPSSNNGWVYSAMAKHLNLPINHGLQTETYLKCRNCAQDFMRIDRLPGKRTPPLSHDELIGLKSLNKINADMMKVYDWYMYGDVRTYATISWFSAIKEAYKHRKEHRNFWWETNNMGMAKLSNKVKPWHKSYIKNDPSLIFYLHVIHTAIFGDTSSKNLCLLMCEDLRCNWLKLLFNKKKQYKKYFGEDHIFYKVLCTTR